MLCEHNKFMFLFQYGIRTCSSSYLERKNKNFFQICPAIQARYFLTKRSYFHSTGDLCSISILSVADNAVLLDLFSSQA